VLGCSIRKWKSIREALVEMDKLQVSGEFLTNYRAVSELETLSKLQDKQRENASGPRENKGLAKPRLNHTEPEPEPESTTVEKADDASQEIPREKRERLLAAMGADPVSGMHGPNGRRLGTVNDMAISEKWDSLGLSEAEQLGVVKQIMARMQSPPNTFNYFSQAMSDLAAQKKAPLPISEGGGRDERSSKVAKWRKTA